MNWMSFYSESDQRLLSLKIISKSSQDFYITVVDSNNSLSLEVKLHPFINLQVTTENEITRVTF